jgi:type I restriction enzyme M protein
MQTKFLGGNVKMKLKRIIAGLLAMVMLLTATLPTSNVKAASGTASLDSLGKLGTVNVGSKSESGIWLQTLVNEKPVFCMDLGLACHTGYTYISKTKTISSDSSNKKDALEAKIGYWYAISKNKSNKAWVYAQFVFLGKASEIGYEQGKRSYKQTEKNDLQEFEYMTDEVFEGIKVTSNDGECGWIEHNLITNYRIDANYLLNKIDKKKLEELYKEVIPLAEVCSVVNESVSVRANTIYNYLEVLDISPQTGSITNVRKVSGKEIGDSFHLFYGGDILFTRINPRINRVAIAPPVKPFGIMSKEIYRILYKKNKYISEENRYVICAILQNEWVIKQIIRLSTGSSSSRARVQVEDLLNDVYIPVLDEKVQKEISDSTYSVSKKLWNLSQKILKSYVKNQKILGGDVDKDQLRGI